MNRLATMTDGSERAPTGRQITAQGADISAGARHVLMLVPRGCVEPWVKREIPTASPERNYESRAPSGVLMVLTGCTCRRNELALRSLKNLYAFSESRPC